MKIEQEEKAPRRTPSFQPLVASKALLSHLKTQNNEFHQIITPNLTKKNMKLKSMFDNISPKNPST